MEYNDLTKELGQNFIEYAAAVNTDRAIPDATSGLKPVARRILYGAYSGGRTSNKQYVKCARIVGDVMGALHPHGDSSIYGALVRLSQPWIMRYPLMDFHGNQGNIGGDGPAASRYTESRLMKLTEDGMLEGLKKKNVTFIPNYDETTEEPITLPSVFPNLLCNPNSGIGVSMACNWLPHNLRDVASAIEKYIEGIDVDYLAPDFPTGGVIINEKDIPKIVSTGRGSVKVRGKYNIEKNKIVFYEIPYGTTIEGLIEEIGAVAEEEIEDIKDVHDESNKKGIRIVIECKRGVDPEVIVKKLWSKTKLQTSISYNQVALVDKTPTELNLKDCLKIYVEHNTECIKKEAEFDLEKNSARLEIVEGLLKALEDIDNIIALIKKSDSSKVAKQNLIDKYSFTENQAKAILDMKLAKLAKLESIELNEEKEELKNKIDELNSLILNYQDRVDVLLTRLKDIVKKYGDDRRTELTNILTPKEDKEIEEVVPEDCVVILTETNRIKRVPKSSFKIQKRNGVGIKSEEDIIKFSTSTNTIDNILMFSNKGRMYKILVDKIPVGTNISKGQSLHTLFQLDKDEKIITALSLDRKETHSKYFMFITKFGIIKKTYIEEYLSVKKNKGINAIKLKDMDEIVSVIAIDEEEILIATSDGKAIRFKSSDINPTGRASVGVKGINLKETDYVVSGIALTEDMILIANKNGYGKRIKINDLNVQKRGGVGVNISPNEIASVICVKENDNIVFCGTNLICVNASEINCLGKVASGVIVSKTGNVNNIVRL